MNIEIVTVGDEVLSGAVVNTNFSWIAEKLWNHGFDLIWQTTVADDPDRMQEAFLAAANRAEIVIVTGGLGPTTDDITLEVAAKTFGVPLVLNQEALREIKSFFKRLGREITPNNERQAWLPQGAVKISNRFGTAPGCRLEYKKSQFIFLPGVPTEMRGEFQESVLPFLEKINPDRVYYSKQFRCYGVPEASLDQALREVTMPEVRLGWRINYPEVIIKISSKDTHRGEKEIVLAERVIREKIGESIYAEGEETIEERIGRMLKERGESLAVAESCTGGFLSNLITSVPGSSIYFQEGIVSYSNESKQVVLGIDKKIVKEKGAVSPEVAKAMAESVRRISKTTYGIGITGIAGPSGGTPQKPVGTVHIAVAGPKRTSEREYYFPRGREWFKRATSQVALHKLRRMMERSV